MLEQQFWDLTDAHSMISCCPSPGIRTDLNESSFLAAAADTRVAVLQGTESHQLHKSAFTTTKPLQHDDETAPHTP